MNRLSPLATPSATREVLERHGLYTKYALGQNFLVNDDVVRKILELSDVCPDDRVLEVGPGIGTLTSALLQRAAHVTSIEMDRDLPAVLADTLAAWSDRFTLLQMDALDLKLDDLAGDARGLPNKLVSNLPYAVAATIVLDYLQRFDFLQSATVMVQKEVADRIMAKPGTKAYGAYTVKLSLYAQPAGRFPVAPGNFFPPPRVDSAVVRLNRIVADTDAADGRRPLTSQELQCTCTMVDAAFAMRRKTISNSAKTFFAGNPAAQEAFPGILEAASIDPRRRGETLTREEFVTLGLQAAKEGGSQWMRK